MIVWLPEATVCLPDLVSTYPVPELERTSEPQATWQPELHSLGAEQMLVHAGVDTRSLQTCWQWPHAGVSLSHGENWVVQVTWHMASLTWSPSTASMSTSDAGVDTVWLEDKLTTWLNTYSGDFSQLA